MYKKNCFKFLLIEIVEGKIEKIMIFNFPSLYRKFKKCFSFKSK